MSDMFWEILASEVNSALVWALATVRSAHCASELCFFVSRESNHLDRIGEATAPGFVVVDEHCVTRFVNFDLDDNVLFTAGAVVLAQGGTGVPIGGFLSQLKLPTSGPSGRNSVCFPQSIDLLQRSDGKRSLTRP